MNKGRNPVDRRGRHQRGGACRTGHLVVAVVAATGLIMSALGSVASSAGAQTAAARIRMAHLSNGTPPADVYLSSFDGQPKLVLQGLAYGQVSQYLDLAPGAYTAIIRPAGSPASSPAMLTADASVSAGGSYTFAVLGPSTHPTPKVVSDALTPPAPGAGRVRVIQAASGAAKVDVKAVGGSTLATNAAFGSVTDYADVSAGTWTIEASSSTEGKVSKQLAVDPGTVNSLIVFEAAGSKAIEIEAVVDATGIESVPAGGIQTGAGGTAPAPPDGVPPLLIPIAGLALFGGTAGIGAAAARRRRRDASIADPPAPRAVRA